MSWSSEEKDEFKILDTRAKYFLKKARCAKTDEERIKYKNFGLFMNRESQKMIERKEGISIKKIKKLLDILKEYDSLKAL